VLCTNNLWHVRKIAPVVFIIPLKSAIAINIASAVDYHKFSAAILKTKAGLPNFRRHYRRALKFKKNSLTSKVFYYYLFVSIVYG
jgi:hypothetical protein